MKRLLCVKCNQEMNQIKTYNAKDKNAFITNKDGKKELTFTIEEQQCQNKKCGEFGTVKYYQIDGNRAMEIKKRNF